MENKAIVITEQTKELTSKISEDEGYVIQINNEEILNAFINTKISTHCVHKDYKGVRIVTKGVFNMQVNIELIIAIYKEMGKVCECQQYGSNIIINFNRNILEAEIEIYPERGYNILYNRRCQYARAILIYNTHNR